VIAKARLDRLPAGQARDDEDQAPAHRGLRGRGLSAWYKGGKGTLVGSLLLGLYDDAGVLHHVGIAASFKQEVRGATRAQLEPLTVGARERSSVEDWADWQEQERAPAPAGATSRWNRGKDLSWEPIKLRLVCEVSYDTCKGRGFVTRRTSSAGAPQAPHRVSLRSARPRPRRS